MLKNTRSPCFRALTFNSNTNRIKPYHMSKCRVDFSQINIGWTKPTLETWAKPRKKEQQIGSSYKRPTAPKWLTNWHLNCKGLQTNMPQNVGSVEDLISKNTQSGHMEFCSLRASSPISYLGEWNESRENACATWKWVILENERTLGTSSNGTRVSEEDGGSIVASSPVQHQQEGDYRKSRWNHIWRVFILEGCKNELCHLQVSRMPLDLS